MDKLTPARPSSISKRFQPRSCRAVAAPSAAPINPPRAPHGEISASAVSVSAPASGVSQNTVWATPFRVARAQKLKLPTIGPQPLGHGVEREDVARGLPPADDLGP